MIEKTKDMKRIFSLIAIVALAFIQGCSFEEMKGEIDTPKADPYRVQIWSDIFQHAATKVTTDGFCTGDQVGVYLVNYNGATPGTLKVKGNQADNVRFSYDENGNWVSDYDIYYKDNETNVDFYGYYPYAAPISIEAYPFEVARDQSKGEEHGQMAPYEASDFLWANTKNVTPTNSKVALTFRHQMSSARVRFSQGTGWDNAAEYAAVTKEVLVTNTIRKSTINLATGVVTPEGEAPLTGTIPINDNGEFRAIVVPQTVAAGKTLLTITIGGLPRHYVRDLETEYLPGKITTYDFSVNKKSNTGEYELQLNGINITAWEADNFSHGDDAREYVVVHNAIPGRLERAVDGLSLDISKVKNLKVTGAMNADDYKYIRNGFTALQRLNLREVESIIDGVYSIPLGAFNGMRTLVKCVFPERLERIENDAFTGTRLSGMLMLPDGIKYVSGFNSTAISNVYFPATLEVIDGFSGCENLTCEIVFPNSLKEIGSFSGSAISGELIIPESVEKIGSFSYCANLRGNLIIPKGIKSVGGFSYSGFSGNLILPDGLQTIQSYAFEGSNLKGVLNIPSSVTEIGSRAFANTLFSDQIILPQELATLGQGAFSGCWRLSGIVEFPKDLLVVPHSLFKGCSNLEGVKFHKDIEVVEADAFNGCYGINLIVCDSKNPPVAHTSSFSGVQKANFTVEVPENSIAKYRTADVWSDFTRISAYRDFSISKRLFRTLNRECTREFVLRAPSGESWTVEDKPEWVTVEPMSGIGKTEISITASDLAHGADNRFGEIVFLLEGKDNRSRITVEQYDYSYGEGDVITLQKATKGNGVNIVMMGDCFDAKDISEGKYLQAMQDAYEYFFDVEPYLTYKDYFNVYGVFGVSPDSGIGNVNTVKEARFGTQYSVIRGENNSRVAPDETLAFEAACKAPINNDVSRTLIIMLENTSEYEGCCYLWGDGSAIAVVPLSTDPEPYGLRGGVHHEAGGHGFGKLADEYIYHNAFFTACSCSCCSHDVRDFMSMKESGFYENVSMVGNITEVPWAHMIYDPQFSNLVDVYEGAYLHARGMFRCEPVSCMRNNIPYYNAISRESIVKRIKKYAGEEYSFEEFKSNDKESLPGSIAKGVKSVECDLSDMPSHYAPLPCYMGEKPSFKQSNF